MMDNGHSSALGRLAAVAVVALLPALMPSDGAVQAGRARDGTGLAVWVPTDAMGVPRAYQATLLLPSGHVLVVGGVWGGNSSLQSAEIYDPTTGVFSQTGSLTYPTAHATATLLSDGRVLVAGGANMEDAMNAADLYDEGTGTFTPTGGMSVVRTDHTATLLPNGKVLITGGCNGYESACYQTWASAELYDPASGTFTTTGSMSTARMFHTATLLPDGKVLIAGGVPCVVCYATASADLYDPTTGTFSPTGSMLTARALHTATLLPDGKVLVAGGCTAADESCTYDTTNLASAELYDPATGRWTATSSMSMPRYHHTATLLPDGQVLVAGGAVLPPNTEAGLALASAELYDPTTGMWTPTASMTTPRDVHTATLLPDGKVLVAGGCSTYPNGLCVGASLRSAEVYVAGGSGVPVVTPAAVAFGGQPLFTRSATQTITLSNTGTLPMTPTALTLTGPAALDYHAATTDCLGQVLVLGAACTLTVSFRPLALGSRSATLSVRLDGGDAPLIAPPAIALTGVGTYLAAVPPLGPPGAAIMVGGGSFRRHEPVRARWQPGGLDLGAQSATASGGVSLTVTLPLSPSGVYSVTLTGLTSGITASVPVTLPAQQLTVTPTLAAPGATLAVSGTGYAPHEAVTLLLCGPLTCHARLRLGQVRADGGGAFADVPLRLPLGVPPATDSLWGQGARAADLTWTPLTVTP